MADSHRHKTYQGVVFMLVATLALALMGMCVKQMRGAVPVFEIMLVRYGIGLVWLLPFIFRKRFSFRVNCSWHYVARIVAALIAVSCSYFALQFMPVADVYLLTNTAALFVPIVAFFLLKAKTSKEVVISSLIGFGGAALVLRPTAGVFAWPALVALGSGLLVAVSIVELRLIGGRSTPLQTIFYYHLGGAIYGVCFAFFNWQPLGGHLWSLGGVALFGFIYQWMLTYSFRVASVRIISPLLFISVLYGAVIDWIVWGHVPHGLTVLGMLLVTGGAIATVLLGQRTIYGKK